MSDIDRGRVTLSDEDRLPWLEAVEDEDDDDGVSPAKLIALVLVALVAIGLVVGGLFWIKQGMAPKGDGSLIAAPKGDYKVPATAADGNGMKVEGLGDATYAASQGVDVNSTIDTTSQPEQPVTEGGAPAPAAAAATPPPAPVAKAAAPLPVKKVEAVKLPTSVPAPVSAPVATPVSGPAASKQIGAYSSQAKAEAGRRDLNSRFPALHGLALSIEQGTSAGKTVFRIYMKGGKAKVDAVCSALHSAKEGCIPG